MHYRKIVVTIVFINVEALINLTRTRGAASSKLYSGGYGVLIPSTRISYAFEFEY